MPDLERVQKYFPSVLPTKSTSTIQELVTDITTDYVVGSSRSLLEGIAGKVIAASKESSSSRALELIKEAQEEYQRGNIDLRNALSPPESEDLTESNFIDKYLNRYYGRRDEGKFFGIPFPWETITNQTGGMHPGDLSVIVARTGVGKTYALICTAVHAFLTGASVLVYSGEMSVQDIMDRVVAFLAKIPYSNLRRGTLSPRQEDELKNALNHVKNMPNFLKVLGSGQDMGGASVSSLRGHIMANNPDIVLIDGAYLLDDDKGSKDKYVKAGNIVRDIKRACLADKVPILISWQNNRKGKDESADTDSLALTDDLGQDSTTILRLFQTQDMKLQKRMRIQVLKGRETPTFSLETMWDFNNMNMVEELGVEGLDIEDESEYFSDVTQAEIYNEPPEINEFPEFA